MKTLLALLLFALPAAAQDTVTVGSPIVLAWDQDAPSLSAAQSYNYKMYISPAADTVLTNVTCVAGAVPSAFVCSAPLMALTVGTYTIELTASSNGLESAKSTPVYTLNVVSAPTPPKPPRGVRRGQQ